MSEPCVCGFDVGCGTGNMQHAEQCKVLQYVTVADSFTLVSKNPADDPKQKGRLNELEDLHEQLTDREKFWVPTPSFYCAELTKKLGGDCTGVVMCACGASIYSVSTTFKCIDCSRIHHVPDKYRGPLQATIVCKCGHTFSRKNQDGICPKCEYSNWAPDPTKVGWDKDRRGVNCIKCGHTTRTSKMPGHLLPCEECMALVDCPKHLRDLIGTPLIEAIKEIPKADPIVLEYQAAMLRREKRQKAREELLNAENLPKGRVEQLFAILNT